MKEYCEFCGKETTSISTSKFSKITGERLFKNVCLNPFCVIGCERLGHVWGPWSGSWMTPNRVRICSRCKMDEYSSYY